MTMLDTTAKNWLWSTIGDEMKLEHIEKKDFIDQLEKNPHLQKLALTLWKPTKELTEKECTSKFTALKVMLKTEVKKTKQAMQEVLAKKEKADLSTLQSLDVPYLVKDNTWAPSFLKLAETCSYDHIRKLVEKGNFEGINTIIQDLNTLTKQVQASLKAGMKNPSVEEMQKIITLCTYLSELTQKVGSFTHNILLEMENKLAHEKQLSTFELLYALATNAPLQHAKTYTPEEQGVIQSLQGLKTTTRELAITIEAQKNFFTLLSRIKKSQNQLPKAEIATELPPASPTTKAIIDKFIQLDKYFGTNQFQSLAISWTSTTVGTMVPKAMKQQQALLGNFLEHALRMLSKPTDSDTTLTQQWKTAQAVKEMAFHFRDVTNRAMFSMVAKRDREGTIEFLWNFFSPSKPKQFTKEEQQSYDNLQELSKQLLEMELAAKLQQTQIALLLK